MQWNWFIFSVAVMQTLGAGQYALDHRWKLGALYFLYALTNFILCTFKGE